MRGSVVILACAACSASHGGVDAGEPRVYVVNHITPLGPFETTFSTEVSFLGPDGAMVPGTRVSDPGSDAGQYGMVYAVMPDGGSLTVSTHNGYTPTSNRYDNWSIAGVKPGDRYRFDDSAPKLPADCTRRTITSFTVDATRTQASWSDPDAAAVDARMVHRASGCPGGVPPVTCSFTEQVDGTTATSVTGLSFSITGQMDLTSVDVISCPNESYDDLRPLLTGRFDPVVGPPP